MRTNVTAVLARVRQECLPAGWPVRARGRPEVDLLYSLRVGPPGASRGSRNFHLLYASAARVARSLDLDEVLAELRNRLLRDVPWLASELVALRATVVERAGRAVLLIGGSPGWAEALRRQGARVQDLGPALLDAEGLAVPLPPPRALGGRRQTAGLPVRAVVFPVDAGAARLRVLPPGDAALRLFAACPQAATHPARVLGVLARLAEQTPCLEARHADPDAGVAALLHRLDAARS